MKRVIQRLKHKHWRGAQAENGLETAPVLEFIN
jgi:hypothetical protein